MHSSHTLLDKHPVAGLCQKPSRSCAIHQYLAGKACFHQSDQDQRAPVTPSESNPIHEVVARHQDAEGKGEQKLKRTCASPAAPRLTGGTMRSSSSALPGSQKAPPWSPGSPRPGPHSCAVSLLKYTSTVPGSSPARAAKLGYFC